MASQVEALEQFIAERKFADIAWQRRGLNPSPAALCAKLEGMFNQVAAELAAQSTAGASQKELKRTLTTFLGMTQRSEFDTEEGEFVCDQVARLAKMMNVDVGKSLNRWLYGPVLGTLVNLTRGKPKA